jgi:hypothetical protein
MKFNCDQCGTEFESIFGFGASKQALGCSAILYERQGEFYALGCYGSRQHDMRKYRLKGTDYKIGEICDECINTLIKEGDAALIEDGVW